MPECIEVCCRQIDECTVDSHNLGRFRRIDLLFSSSSYQIKVNDVVVENLLLGIL